MLALAATILGSRSSSTRSSRRSVDVPRVHPDEVRYAIAGSSLVEGEGLSLRGGDYGFGPLYALVLAGILFLSSGLAAAYDVFKAANALFFALTAIPVYLLARRLVTEWWAVLAAALSVAIPSSISVATVMTESLSFFTCAWALYAIVLALERPTTGRQLALLGAVAAAFLTRPQFGALYVTWLLALALVWLILPARRPRTRADLLGLWPSAVPLAARRRRPREPPGVRELSEGVLRRVLGALARLRPAPGGEVVRLPPRRLRDLPRRHTRGRCADRPLEPAP